MRRRLHALLWVGSLSGVLFASCLARRDKPFVRQTDDDAGTPDATLIDGSAPPDAAPDALDLAPHVVLGVDPPHGPFTGGRPVIIRGNGFRSDARVWFGEVEVATADITPVDPQRIQVVTPPGATGAVDITVQNGKAESTSATLTGGYTYDRFVVEPDSGPTAGGTVITVKGDDTNWDPSTEIDIDREVCTDIMILSPTELTCVTPPGEAGARVLSVIADGEREDLLDGFTYGNAVQDDSRFRAALNGQPLGHDLTVLAFDNIKGMALPGVSVLVGDDVDSGAVKQTDRDGVATFSGDWGGKTSVTLAAKCFQPITFYDVPVDHLTAYLDPVISPACGNPKLQLPPAGPTPGIGAAVSGEIVWAPDEELKRRGWSNVPQPVVDSEKDVAYVFRLSSRRDAKFSLPSASNRITRENEGPVGYKFYQSTSPGNFTMYVLAGLEDDSRSPPAFTAYAMGLLRGVAVKPGKTSDTVYIPVDVPLDRAITVTLDPPEVGPRGPDRIRASLAVEVQDQGFALLPNGVTEHALPGASDFSFVGIPPLVGTLAGSKYALGAQAVTSAQGTPPLSVIGAFSTTSSNSDPLNLGGFVPVPVVTNPPQDSNWDLRSLGLAKVKGERVDLTVVRIDAGAGLYTWTLVAPGARQELALPSLEQLAPDGALPHGSMTIEVTLARIDPEQTGTGKAEAFDYGGLRYRQLDERGWNAYATDRFNTEH